MTLRRSYPPCSLPSKPHSYHCTPATSLLRICHLMHYKRMQLKSYAAKLRRRSTTCCASNTPLGWTSCPNALACYTCPPTPRVMYHCPPQCHRWLLCAAFKLLCSELQPKQSIRSPACRTAPLPRQLMTLVRKPTTRPHNFPLCYLQVQALPPAVRRLLPSLPRRPN